MIKTAALAPLLVMQPAMGAGVTASGTAAPERNCFESVLAHTGFCAGLCVSAVPIDWISR